MKISSTIKPLIFTSQYWLPVRKPLKINKYMNVMKRNLLLLIVTLLTAVCPVIAQAQTKTVVAELTQSSDNSSYYTLTFKAVSGTPKYVISGIGVYDIQRNIYNYGGSGSYGYQYGSKINHVKLDETIKDVYPMSTAYWFARLSAVKTIENLEYLNTSQVINMEGMFFDCSNLTDLNLSRFNTGNVTNMNMMFSYCSHLTSLTLSSFNTENVTNMAAMFSGCTNLASLSLSSFNTEKVVTMASMFAKCQSITNLNLSNFKTGNVTNMSYMFDGCSGLTSLNVTSFNTSNVTDMGYMFRDCKNLVELDVSKFDTQNVTSMECMFSSCESLTSIDVSNFNTSKVTSMYQMFDRCMKVTELDVSNFDTGNVTNMYAMFYECESLTSLDVSKFDTHNVTTMGMMFDFCKNIRELDVSKFNTEKVKDMSYMFYNCVNLANLDVSNFVTKNVTDMQSMFNSCYSLKSLDVTNFNTENVKYMNYMFNNCYGLTSLDVSNFNTSNVTNMEHMFAFSRGLKSLDISNFDFSKVTNVQELVAYCYGLRDLNIGNLDISKIQYRYGTFNGAGQDYPCHITAAVGRDALGKATISKTQLPPYYNYGGGRFTIADILDTETDYSVKVNDDADLWVKARTLKGGKWNTLVIPAGYTQEQMEQSFGSGYEVCAIDSYDGTTLKFKTLEGTTTANTPVLVKPASDIKNLAFINVKVEDTNNDLIVTTEPVNGYTASFIGTYNKEIKLGGDCYYYYEGTFYRSAGASIANNTRAYFKFSDVNTDTKGAPAKRFVVDDGTTVTAIDAIDGKPVNADLPAYNLAGQRVGKDYKGVVIVGGKKILRK